MRPTPAALGALLAACSLATAAVRLARLRHCPLEEVAAARKRLSARPHVVVLDAAGLCQTRRDFSTVWHVCRTGATLSSNSNLIRDLLRLFGEFHWRYGLVRLGVFLGLRRSIRDADELALVTARFLEPLPDAE